MKEEVVGSIEGTNGCYRIASSIFIDANIEGVWKTATSSEEIGWWFAPGIVEGEGGKIQLNYPDGRFGMTGEVKVLFRNNVFEFTWDKHEHSDETTLIRFDFVSVGEEKTKVTMSSFVFDHFDNAVMVVATWRFMLERMQRAVRVHAAIPDDENRIAEIIETIRSDHLTSPR